MAVIVTRSGKGSALSHAEADANFTNLNVGKAEASPPVASGTNTITASLSPTISSYTTNRVYEIQIANDNTGAVTLNIDSVGALAVQDIAGNALLGGELVDGMVARFLYNGTNFRILNPRASRGDSSNYGPPSLFYPWISSSAYPEYEIIAGGAVESTWTNLDSQTVLDSDIPNHATAIECAVFFFTTSIGAGEASLVLRVRPGGSTMSENDIIPTGWQLTGTENEQYSFGMPMTIPLSGTDGVFSVYWTDINVSNPAIALSLRGYYAPGNRE